MEHQADVSSSEENPVTHLFKYKAPPLLVPQPPRGRLKHGHPENLDTQEQAHRVEHGLYTAGRTFPISRGTQTPVGTYRLVHDGGGVEVVWLQLGSLSPVLGRGLEGTEGEMEG